MISRSVFAAALLTALTCGVRTAWADEAAPRVVLLSVPGQDPSAEQVADHLGEQLGSVGVRVDITTAEEVPTLSARWADLAREAASRPGTLALIGWVCRSESCALTVAEPRSGAVAEIPVDPFEGSEHADDLAFAIAATSREAIVGSLLPELGRLTVEGEDPSPPPSTGDRVPQAYQPEAVPDARGLRPWLWFEGGYNGEHPYPQGQPLHGPWFGLAFEARRWIVPALAFGWLGLQRVTNQAGEVRSHRIPIAVELRIAVPVGPATFSVAPVGRLDVVFASADPAGPDAGSSRVEVELHVGGRTCWNLPLPGGVEAILGAGILGTLLGHDYSVDGRQAIAESRLRFGWWVGVAWSPISR
jgi:hypothetical protein